MMLRLIAVPGRYRLLCPAIVLALFAPSAQAGAADPPLQSFSRFVEALAADPSAPPGFAVVVVDKDRTVYAKAFGTRDLRTRAALTLDTAMYNGSLTKAYVGLLAARLDGEGRLPLSSSLKDVWPDITLPTRHDPAAITAAALLSHSSGIEAGGLNWRYGTTGEFVPADVPAHLAAYATASDRAFEYGNFGPVVYTAMAEKRTGEDWRDLLRSYVFRPLGLSRTSARPEDLPAAETALCHTRSQGLWRPLTKPAALFNAGGGMNASPRDTASFLAAFASRGRSAAGMISPAILAKTYQPVSRQDQDFFGFKRWGYGLGWDLATYGGRQVVARSGGYTGCRSMMAFLPERGLGIVVLTLGDVGGNLLNASIIQQGFDYWTQNPAADQRAGERLRTFSADVGKAIAEIDKAVLPKWRPPLAGGEDYVGWYENKRLGRISVALHPGGLIATAGASTMSLAPGKPDAFEAVDTLTFQGPTALVFRRDARNKVGSLMLDDDEYQKRANP